MNKKDCQLVQDLLPSYIDGITSSDTNEFIKSHLEKCEKCTKIFNNMKKKDNVEESNKAKKFINFAKKYNKKYKILKSIIILILILFIISFTRNAIIISSLENKADKSLLRNNYHSTFYEYGLNSIHIIDFYVKDGKYLATSKIINKENWCMESITTETFDGNTYNIFHENFDEIEDTDNKKFVHLDTTPFIPKMEYFSDIRSEGIFGFILNCIFADIDTIKCNGIETYRFRDLYSHTSKISETFIDKETGLMVRNSGKWTKIGDEEYNSVCDYYIEFDVVTDEDLKGPNIEDYYIVEE